MAHRDGATGAADTVDPTGTARDDAGEDAVTAQGPQEHAGDGEPADGATASVGDSTDQAASPDAPPAAASAASAEAEAAAGGTGRKHRLPRPATGRTPAFGLSLGAIRQRAAGGDEDTAALRRNLADKEAQTAELREALDALRQALDDTTPPKGPDAVPAAASRRRGPLLGLLALLAVVVVVVVAVATRGGGSGTATPPSASPSASAPPSSARPSASATQPAASPSASAPTASASSAPAVATTPMAWRGQSLLTPPAAPSTGPGVDSPGTDLTVAIDADLEHVDVFERVVFDAPRTTLTLALPPATAWGSSLAGAAPVVSDLQVVIDDVAVRPQRRDAGWFALPPNGSTVTKVELRYRVAGTIVNYEGSKPARRSIGVPSFTGQGSFDASLPLHVTVDDPRVQNLFCLSAEGVTGICAAGGTDGLSANLTGGSPVVLLQADLVPLG